MPLFRETGASRFASRGLDPQDAVLFCAVCAFFFFLPLRTDATATILVMTVCGILALRRHAAFGSLLARGVRLPVLAFVFFMAIAFAASLLNPATFSKFPRILLWGCCVFSGLALSVCLPDNGGKYFWALFAALALSFLAAIVFYGYASPHIWHDGRLKLFAMHPSRLGLYAAVCLLFLLYRTLAGVGRERLFGLAGALLVFFILFNTNTRGNLLMLPLGLLCLAAVLPRRHLKRMAVALCLCAVLGGVALSLSSPFVVKRLVSAVTSPLEDATFKSRLPIWHVGWEIVKDSPLVGHGHQSYLKLHARYLEKHEARLALRYPSFEQSVKQAHNVILGRLVETGFLGTAGFLLFYFGAIAAALRGPEQNRWLIAPLVFYMAMSMFDDGLFRINDTFILLLAGTALGGLVRRGAARAAYFIPDGTPCI